VVVLEVLPRTPAERQGLRAYDVITKAAGRPVRNERDLKEAVQASKDAKLELEYVRGGKRQYVAVAPEAAPPQPQQTAAAVPPGHPRELLVLPHGFYSSDGNGIVFSPDSSRVGVVPPALQGGGNGGSTAEQLERITAELQQVRASIEALRAQMAAEEQQKKAEEKK
jgi:hypothetical protein